MELLDDTKIGEIVKDGKTIPIYYKDIFPTFKNSINSELAKARLWSKTSPHLGKQIDIMAKQELQIKKFIDYRSKVKHAYKSKDWTLLEEMMQADDEICPLGLKVVNDGHKVIDGHNCPEHYTCQYCGHAHERKSN